MKVARAMKDLGLRYFSSLNPCQKDKVIFDVLVLKHNLTQQPKEFAKRLIFEIDDTQVHQELKKAKMFKYEGNYYPLNINDLIQKL